MNYYPNMNYDYIGATGENNIKDYIDITNNIYDIISSNFTIANTSNSSNFTIAKIDEVNNKISGIEQSIAGIEQSISGLQDEIIVVQGETTTNTAAIADLSPIVAADTITLGGLVITVGGHVIAISGIIDDLGDCLKKENIDSGNIGLYQSIGGAFLNIVYNPDHFKDVSILGTNRQFNLNDVYANLPTTKNDVITWDAPLNYNTSTKRASIDLSNYYIKSEITNIISNTSNYASNISNVIIRNTSNFTSGTAFNTSNYASNISNVIIQNSSNFTSGTAFNTSNYASNISNIIITNTSNYASNISNVLLINYNSLNTNTNINTSNYASNISNIIITNTSNYASNISNVLLINYNSLNINTSNYASNISNVIIRNTSNYASNISNVLLINYNSLNTNTNTNISNYASNISNVLLINYNSLNTNTSNYATNISNIIISNNSNFTGGIAINTSNYATNISNIIIANNSNFTLGTSNILTNLINSNLDICNAWTKSNNYIYNTNLGKVGIGINTPTGLLELYKNTLSTNAQFKFGHEERWPINHMFSLTFMRFLSAYTLTNEIAHFGYVDSYDNPLLRTTVLKITKDEMEMDGDLYLNKMNLSSSVGVYLSGKSNEISSLFSSKPPFAAYFAEDFTGSTIPNYLKNGRDATTTGTITQTTAAGNGVNTPITYITGTSTSTISFAAGSIPTTFTILSFTRYNGGTRKRILTSKTTGDWCHGHRNNNRGAVRYLIDRAAISYISEIDNWACVIGKNVGSTGSILLNGVDNSLNQNGTGGFTLGINNGVYPAEYGDWAFNCVIIWDTALTNAEMVLLNGMINTYKSTGKSLKQYFNDDCIMENREYTTNSSRELLLLKSNNLNSSFGTDRIRLKAKNILFDTFSTATTDKTETTQMIIDSSGNIGIGTTTNISSKLYINGNININNSVNPFLKLGGNDNNLGVATIGGSFSGSSSIGDMVLRSTNNLILQSGIGFYAIKINTANNVEFRLTLTAPTINLTTSTTGNNVLFIKSTVSGANNCIQINNNLDKTAYIGVGGSTIGGNYANNFFIESAHGGIILNTQGRGSGSTPNLLINTAGNVITSGDISSGGSINIINGTSILNMGQRVQDNIINLWSNGTSIYGFGINNNTLRYNTPPAGTHKFYTGTTNTFTIDASGNAISTAYMYAGGTTSGMRINGNDYGNTFYQDAITIGGAAADVGFTLRETNSFKFNSLVAGVGYKTFITMSTSGIRIPQTSYTFAIADWYLYQGTAPGSITNSFIFFHSASGFNSKWWFNGTQTATSSEISDERVKTDIEPITDGLNKVMKLQPKKFNVLNDKNKKFQYGFISQDIEKEMPEIIYKENHYIANVYEYGNHKDKIITMKKNINGLINIGDQLKIILENDEENKEYLLNASYEYNLFKKRFCKVINIIDDYSFEIDINICISEEEPPTATRERQLEIQADEVFIYGKYVNDFKTLEYNSLISLNVCATQELYKLIQNLQEQINELKTKII